MSMHLQHGARTTGTAYVLSRMHAPTLLLLVSFAAPVLARGDDPPPGLPWIRTYDDARRDALSKGRPVCIYFTKTY